MIATAFLFVALVVVAFAIGFGLGWNANNLLELRRLTRRK